VDTHSQSIRTDPEIYLPGEVDGDDEDNDNDNDGENNDGKVFDEPIDVSTGMKRKATTRTKNSFPTKIAKTGARAGPSTAALNVIDDRRPDLTLIDVPVGESILSYPYGRHSCLYIEVKLDTNKKPNPQEVVCRLSVRFFITKGVS